MCSTVGSVTVTLRWNSDGETKSRPFALGRAGPDATAEALDDLLADRQPKSGAGVARLGVQALEGLENPIEIALLDTQAVVAHAKAPKLARLRRRYVNARGDAGP